MANISSPRSRRVLIGLAFVLLLAAVGFGTWWLTRPIPKPEIDMAAVLSANNRGVGHMAWFSVGFKKAVQEFEEVVRLAPDWAPGKINLAIALMNLARGELPFEETDQAYLRAISILEDVLKQNAANDYAAYAHFNLGLILRWRGDPNQFEAARQHFEAVTRIDDHDSFAWFNLGSVLSDLGEPRDRVMKCYKNALHFDPYQNAALQAVHHELRREGKNEEADALLAEMQALRRSQWETKTREDKYSERGRYAEVIAFGPSWPVSSPAGPLPLFVKQEKLTVQLAPATRWATTKDFGTGAVAELRNAVRRRFGGVIVVLDYNGDGRPDLFLLSAVVENGQVRDLLLRNDGDGHFTDVTREAGLADARPSLGCVVADFDNDRLPDLFITGVGEQHLFRNNGKGGFIDVTKEAGLDQLTSVCLTATFVDLDQDCDLDLLVVELAATPDAALPLLNGNSAAAGSRVAVYLNTGEAPPEEAAQDPLPLKPGFRRDEKLSSLFSTSKSLIAGLAITDIDSDYDPDCLVLADRNLPSVMLNDRLLRFHRAELPQSLVEPAAWNGALVFDLNHDEHSDLLLLRRGRTPALLVHRPVFQEPEPAKWFDPGAINSPPLRQAHVADVDLDGFPDIVGLDEKGKPVLLHNDGQRLAIAPEALGRDGDWPTDLIAVQVGDFRCRGLADLITWSESQGLQLLVNQGNGNHGVKLDLIGHRRLSTTKEPMRVNSQGFGTRVSIHAGETISSAEQTTLSAGLGQSLQPLLFGLGRHTEPDVIRLRWPDQSIQAEFNSVSANACRTVALDQENRKKTSCPILFTWNGRRFEFVTDFLGAGSIGEPQPEGGHRPPRPEESVKIESEQLVPRDGKYILKFVEPMDEISYLDRLQLLVLDHPAELRIFPDERFATADPPASQDLIAFRQEIYPIKAVDHKSHDVTAKLGAWDRDTVDGFSKRAWIGFAENHGVELDFGDRLSKFVPTDRLVLCLAGWTDYAYPESIWAAHQAGVELEFPVLERLGPDGEWQKIADAGFPAGLPRMMTLDVTGKLTSERCVLRLRTNLHVYWDQIFIAPVTDRIARADADKGCSTGMGLRVTPLEVDSTRLEARGCVQEFSPDGRQPTIYDYDRLAAFPVNKLKGYLTRFGDVTELLRDADDRFVIFGAGDELTVQFDATKLPPLPPGWKRSFVLRTSGYCKDSGPFTAHGDTVEPLPFRTMSNYPYGPNEQYTTDRLQGETRHTYNTRRVGTPSRFR
jgi:hypothetical protein